MNKTYKLLTALLCIGSLVFISSCKNEDETATTDEHSDPLITFITPAPGHEFGETDTVKINVRLASQDDIHEYSVKVKNVTENSEAFSYEGHSHEKTADVNLYFIPNVSRDAAMTLTLTTMDHNSHTFSKSVSFKVKNTISASKPVITIVSPSSDMYDAGDRVAISGIVAHNESLKNVKIVLTKDMSAVIDYTQPLSDVKTYNFDTAYTIAPGSAHYSLTVTATDKNDLSETKSIDFHVH